MSRMKIKSPGAKKKKKQKMLEISLKEAAFSHLNIIKSKQHADDEMKVAEMIEEEKLDVSRRYNKKYMEGVARDMGWKVGKLEKVVENMSARMKAIESAIKRVQERNTSTEATQEKKDE